jgi:hypothetical protein
MNSFALLFALFLSFPALALACSCAVIDLKTSLKRADAVFRGTVIRKLNDVDNQSFYEVQVNRVFKGCNLKQSDRVIVATGCNSANCGVNLNVNSSYALFAYNAALEEPIKKQLGKNPKKITQSLTITLCDYNVEWSNVRTQDLKSLRRNNNACASQCVNGGNCPTNHYCDNGKCVAFDATCPTPEVRCLAAPCSVATCTAPSTCYDNYCGGCTAIFVDNTGTRVC